MASLWKDVTLLLLTQNPEEPYSGCPEAQLFASRLGCSLLVTDWSGGCSRLRTFLLLLCDCCGGTLRLAAVLDYFRLRKQGPASVLIFHYLSPSSQREASPGPTPSANTHRRRLHPQIRAPSEQHRQTDVLGIVPAICAQTHTHSIHTHIYTFTQHTFSYIEHLHAGTQHT